MKVIQINEKWKGIWDKIAGKKHFGSFLQSFAWGKFKESLGKKVFRLAVIKTKVSVSDPFTSELKILCITQIIKEPLPILGNFLYVPHGPIFNTKSKQEVFNVLKNKIIEIAKAEKSAFIRFEPKQGLSFAPELRHFKTSIQALYTLKLDLLPPLEEIIACFKQKTRYNIRLAEKKGVRVRVGSRQDLGSFLALLKITAKRDNFFIYPDDYYIKMYECLKPKNMIELVVAEIDREILGVFINIFFNKEAIYLHGATSSKKRNLMASYTLMWETIKRAKQKGCETLDLWGVAPENEINHPWYGFTRFKRGFAPKKHIEAYPGTYFLVLKPLIFRFYLWQKSIRGRRI